MKKFLVLLTLLFSLSACEELLLGSDEVNTPENCFELLWNDFDRHYSLFYIKKTNWDSLYSVYRPQVNSSTSDKQLWKITTDMLDVSNDSHTVLYYKNDQSNFASGYELNAKAKNEEFSLDLIKRIYTGALTKIESEGDLLYGTIRYNDVGYVLLRKTDGDNPEKAMEEVLDYLGDKKAMILDLRTNTGGFAFYSKIIAGAFADGEHFVGTVQVRNGPNHDDFNEKVNEVTQKTGSRQFLKPVIVLTDRATISGGEYLTVHMRSFSHVTHIGDSSAGDFGASGLRRFLPNGWSYTYSIKMFLFPDGTSPDGIGVVPHVYAKNTKDDIARSQDMVLEAALQYLYDVYGI